jgi:hypothetical protein
MKQGMQFWGDCFTNGIYVLGIEKHVIAIVHFDIGGKKNQVFVLKRIALQ